MSAGGDHEAEAPPSKKGDKGDEADAGERRGRAAHTLKQHWCIALRLVELAIAVIAIGLIVDSIASQRVSIFFNLHHVGLIYSTYAGYIIILSVLVGARAFGEQVGWRTSLAFSIIGAVLFTATAAVILYNWQYALSHNPQYRPYRFYYDMTCASGVFAVINAAVFILHAVLTFRKEADY